MACVRMCVRTPGHICILRRMASQVISYTPCSTQELLYQSSCLSQAGLGFYTAPSAPSVWAGPECPLWFQLLYVFSLYNEALTKKNFLVAFKQNNHGGGLLMSTGAHHILINLPQAASTHPTSLLNSSSQGSRKSIWRPSQLSFHSG